MKLKLSSFSILGVLIVCLILALCVLPPDSFYTCDNGMKYLQVFYLVRNGFRSDAIPYAGSFIDPEEKFFPVLPPFAYRIGNATYPQYPLLFAALSAFPYMLFGFRGLYLIPVASTVVSSLLVLRLLAGVGIGDARRGALYVLFYAFGTPVFFYSLIFWEHTFCVMLFLAAVLAICRGIAGRSARRFAAAGIFLGIFLLARFESAVYCLACFAALLVAVRPRLRNLLCLVLPVIAFALLLFLFNSSYYGRPVGPHFSQVMREKLGASGHLILAARLLVAPVSGLLVMCPFMLILFARKRLWGSDATVRDEAVTATVRFLYLAAVFSTALVALTTYNDGGRQWGPRYLLPVVPLGVVLLAAAGEGGGKALKRGIAFLVAASVCISFLGVWTLYRRKAFELSPAVSWLKSCECDSIVFPSTYAVLEMAAAFPDRAFFFARGFGDFLEIADRLSGAGGTEVASCKWEEGSFTELYDRSPERVVESPSAFLRLKRVERFPASRDYTFYRWSMRREPPGVRDGGAARLPGR